MFSTKGIGGNKAFNLQRKCYDDKKKYNKILQK